MLLHRQLRNGVSLFKYVDDLTLHHICWTNFYVQLLEQTDADAFQRFSKCEQLRFTYGITGSRQTGPVMIKK